ncbi:HAD family hydrolase [Pedobacter sp. MW01-1-1]|uniref:HAD family hydrolase n=1 Tax=Pedobacter sp. MW01-1-1 TaxID=3383027 RepID=UPI003FEE42C2
MLDKFKVLIWDFDGVIMNSMSIRSKGLELVLAEYPKEQVEALGMYHNENGGLSRYHKFRYFFEEIRKESIICEKVMILAGKFSEIMHQNIINMELLIQDSVAFIKENFLKCEMHIVSVSDGTELNQICEAMGLKRYFKTKNGSPTSKNELAGMLIEKNDYDKVEVVVIDDSINDYQEAQKSAITFAGYNNVKLKELGDIYISIFR